MYTCIYLACVFTTNTRCNTRSSANYLQCIANFSVDITSTVYYTCHMKGTKQNITITITYVCLLKYTSQVHRIHINMLILNIYKRAYICTLVCSFKFRLQR